MVIGLPCTGTRKIEDRIGTIEIARRHALGEHEAEAGVVLQRDDGGLQGLV